MNKIAIAVHGGASYLTSFLEQHIKETEEGLAEAVRTGYSILKKGGWALDAVEEAVKLLEDNPLFNAGRGSALNSDGQVEMDAALMDGEHLKAGAVSMVRQVRNPISLARAVMNHTNHVFLSGYGALNIAKKLQLPLESPSYFLTDFQYDEFKKDQAIETLAEQEQKQRQGTVGVVALDCNGNLAAGTSTGGTSNCLPGRVGDSCIIGAGCYANNKTCAVSGTGDGEYLITGVIANTISLMVEFKMGIQEACDYVLHERNAGIAGVMGVISVTPQGEIGISFTSEVMKRAWMSSDEPLQVKIYRDPVYE